MMGIKSNGFVEISYSMIKVAFVTVGLAAVQVNGIALNHK
jgi:hypothetical protein